MIRGLTQDVEIQGHVADVITPLAPDTSSVIGVICSGDLAVHRAKIKEALQRGIEQRPDAVWVCIEPKSDRMTHDVMISLDIEPVVLPMLGEWRRKQTPCGPLCGDTICFECVVPSHHLYDFRRVWRDLEMLSLCDELIVFHKRSGNSPWRDRAASGLYTKKLFVVEMGKAKAKKAA